MDHENTEMTTVTAVLPRPLTWVRLGWLALLAWTAWMRASWLAKRAAREQGRAIDAAIVMENAEEAKDEAEAVLKESRTGRWNQMLATYDMSRATQKALHAARKLARVSVRVREAEAEEAAATEKVRKVLEEMKLLKAKNGSE